MGADLSPEASQMATRAEIFLRQIAYGQFVTTAADGDVATACDGDRPTPAAESSGRV